MVYNRERGARNAEASKTNKPGTCQLWTRTQFLGKSAGDQDGDGDADAVDGWKSEPLRFRHAGDRNPPRGVPVAFSGGSKGYGHRAISLGGGKIRSTDMSGSTYKPGVVGTTTIAAIEKAMGVSYLGWSDSITGELIPPPTRGARIDKEISDLQATRRHMTATLNSTKGETRRAKLTLAIARVNNAINDLKKIPFI
jgi:hypothetical protein